jgi:hypothetical protein
MADKWAHNADSVSLALVLSSLVIVHQNTQLWPLP